MTTLGEKHMLLSWVMSVHVAQTQIKHDVTVTHLMILVFFGIGDSSSTRITFLPPRWGNVTHWAAFGLWCDVETRAAGVVLSQGVLWLKQDPQRVSAHLVRLGQHVHWNTSGQRGIYPTERLISPPETFNFTLFMVWSFQARWLWDTEIIHVSQISLKVLLNTRFIKVVIP